MSRILGRLVIHLRPSQPKPRRFAIDRNSITTVNAVPYHLATCSFHPQHPQQTVKEGALRANHCFSSIVYTEQVWLTYKNDWCNLLLIANTKTHLFERSANCTFLRFLVWKESSNPKLLQFSTSLGDPCSSDGCEAPKIDENSRFYRKLGPWLVQKFSDKSLFASYLQAWHVFPIFLCYDVRRFAQVCVIDLLCLDKST